MVVRGWPNSEATSRMPARRENGTPGIWRSMGLDEWST
jgi:hypothetical protein